MSDVTAGLDDVAEKIARAMNAVDNDAGSSPVLAAVVREFEAKGAKACAAPGDERTRRDAVIELEQAADSAKAAAEADTGIETDTRQQVLDAHLAICILKASI